MLHQFFSGVQNTSSSAKLGSSTISRSSIAVNAIAQSEIANIVGGVLMNSDLATLDAGLTKGFSKNGFYAGGGIGFFLDSYAGSTTSFYDKAGLTAIGNATYKFDSVPVLISATYIYRLTGKVADTETSFSFGAGYKF
ncbi:MAG: hypothetical protein R8M14_04945 [Ghiorsea sp.]